MPELVYARRALEWREHSTLIFKNLKPAEKSKNHISIIKVVLIFKIRRVWLKNWACHAHFRFEKYLVIKSVNFVARVLSFWI